MQGVPPTDACVLRLAGRGHPAGLGLDRRAPRTRLGREAVGRDGRLGWEVCVALFSERVSGRANRRQWPLTRPFRKPAFKEQRLQGRRLAIPGPPARGPPRGWRRLRPDLRGPRLRRQGRPDRPAGLVASPTRRRRPRRLEARPPGPKPLASGRHRAGPVRPGRRPARARRPGRTDRHHYGLCRKLGIGRVTLYRYVASWSAQRPEASPCLRRLTGNAWWG